MPETEDTIAAIATGIGGGLSILRVSGPEALAVAGRVWRGRPRLAAVPRQLVLGRLGTPGGGTADRCLAVFFPQPASFTGEDVVEFHCHGGALVARTGLALLLANGCRHAEPGEFTRRAFLNGKLDLTQAEAVLEVIQAQSRMALHAANRQLAGSLGRRVDRLWRELSELLAEVEVRLDFVEEDLDWQPPASLGATLAGLGAACGELLSHRREGEILRDGVRLVIAGSPNAGKSSLLNLLLGRDRAIVTAIPGTTRDTLEESLAWRGIPLHLTDTAGLRETTDPVEREGVARSLASIRQAQLVLWVIDLTLPLAGQELDPALTAGKSVIAVANKMDLGQGQLTPAAVGGLPLVHVCARSGEGLDALLDELERQVWGGPHAEEPELALNARHAELLREAQTALAEAGPPLAREEYELLAIHLRAALAALGKITGRTVQPDVLDHIFAKFCIGK